MGNILEEAIRSKVRKEDWTRNLSRQAEMCPAPLLLFVQVNFPWEGLISSSSQSKMMSSTHSLAGYMTGEPPFYSSATRVRLRSPTIMILMGLCMLR